MSVNNPAPSIPAGPTAISIGPASSYAVNSVTVTPTTNTTKKAVPSVVYPGTLPVVGQGNLLQAKDSAIKKPLNSVNCGAAVTNVVTSNKVIAGNAPRQYGKHLLPFVPSFSSVKSSRMNPSGNSILAGSSADSSAGGTSISKTKASYLAPPAKAPRMQSLNSHVSSSLSSNIQGNTMMNKPIISLARTAQTPLIVRSIGLQNQISSVSSVNHQDTNKRFSNVTHQPTTTISITVPARSGLNQSDSNSHYRSSTLPLANNIKHTVQQQPLMMNPSTVLVTTPSSNKIQKVKIPAQAVTPSAVRMSTLSSTTVAATGLTPFNFSSSVTGPRRFQVSPITTTAIPVAKVYSQPHSVRIHGVGTTPVSTISVHSRNSNDLLHSLALRPSPMITITSTFSTATATSSSISSTAFSKIATHSNSSFPGQIIHTGSVTSSGGSNSELRIIQQQHLPPVMVASHSSSLNMSPKPNVPNILRRPNRHNTVNEGSSAIQTQKGRYVPQTAHDITSTGIKAVLPASGNVVGKPVVSSNGVATVASKKNNAAKDFAIARNEKEICVARLPQQTIGEIKIKTDQQHVASMRLNTSAHKAESASAHLAQQQLQQLSYQQHSNKTTGDSASSSSSTTSSVGARPAAVPLSHHHQILQQPSQNKARPVQVQRNLVTVSSIVHRPTTERINVYHGATAATSLTYTPKPLVQSCSTLSTSTITMPSTLSSIGSQQQQQRVLPSRPAGMKRDYDTMMSSGGGGTSTVDSNQHPHHHDKTVLVASSVVAHNSTTSSSYHSPSSSHHRSSMGLSPRKKPRKQTHVVAEELPDDELTDDADECGDSNERNQQHALTPTVSSSSSAPSTSMATAAAVVGNHNNINNNNEKTTTTTTPVPSSTSAASHHSASSSSSSNNPKVGHSKTNNTGKSNSTAAAAPTEAEEDSSKSAGNSRGAGDELQSSAAARSTSPASEYIDDEGVSWKLRRDTVRIITAARIRLLCVTSQPPPTFAPPDDLQSSSCLGLNRASVVTLTSQRKVDTIIELVFCFTSYLTYEDSMRTLQWCQGKFHKSPLFEILPNGFVEFSLALM